MAADATAFGITLERGADGTYLAWVDELPGCFARGRARGETVDRAADAIREFLAWIGEKVPATLDVRVRAEVESAIETDEDTEALVESHREPLRRGHWERIEVWLERSRAELRATLERLSDDELAATRETGGRSIREELEHIAFVELMYAVWTFDLRSRDGIAEFLGWTRGIVAERMRSLGEREADALTYAEWAGAPRPEPWTARKAARRLIWHELLHLRPLQRFEACS